MTWWASAEQVVDRLLVDSTSAFRRLPGNDTAVSGLKVSCYSPRNVIVVNGNRRHWDHHRERPRCCRQRTVRTESDRRRDKLDADLTQFPRLHQGRDIGMDALATWASTTWGARARDAPPSSTQGLLPALGYVSSSKGESVSDPGSSVTISLGVQSLSTVSQHISLEREVGIPLQHRRGTGCWNAHSQERVQVRGADPSRRPGDHAGRDVHGDLQPSRGQRHRSFGHRPRSRGSLSRTSSRCRDPGYFATSDQSYPTQHYVSGGVPPTSSNVLMADARRTRPRYAVR